MLINSSLTFRPVVSFTLLPLLLWAAVQARAVPPLCESSGQGRCYYVSPQTGTDANDGSFERPWRTCRNFSSYGSVALQPTNWVELGAGDVVYLMGGVYSEVFRYGSVSDTNDHRTNVVSLWNVHGTAAQPIRIRAYPGTHPVIDPNRSGVGLYILQCDYLLIEGLEVRNSYRSAVQFAEGSHLEIRNCHIHDNDGVDNDNMSGISVNGVNGMEIHHCSIHDNYDHVCEDTGGRKDANSRNVVLFAGGNIRVHHNLIFHSQLIDAVKTGAGLALKHGLTISNSTLEIDHNVFSNCWDHAIAVAHRSDRQQPSTARVHHNLILNSDGIHAGYLGHDVDHIEPATSSFEQNTIINLNGLAHIRGFTLKPRTNEAGIVPERFIVRRNIFVESGPENEEAGVLVLGVYSSDAEYDAYRAPGVLEFDENCYFKIDGTPRWNFFASNDPQFGGANTGCSCDFAGWQALGYDTNSLVRNPQLDSRWRPQDPACVNLGWAPAQNEVGIRLSYNGAAEIEVNGQPGQEFIFAVLGCA